MLSALSAKKKIKSVKTFLFPHFIEKKEENISIRSNVTSQEKCKDLSLVGIGSNLHISSKRKSPKTPHLCSTDPCRRWCSNVSTKTKPHDPSPLQRFFLPQLVCVSKMCVRTEHFGVVCSRMLLSLVRRDNLDERMIY